MSCELSPFDALWFRFSLAFCSSLCERPLSSAHLCLFFLPHFRIPCERFLNRCLKTYMAIIFPSAAVFGVLPACSLWRASPKYCKGERGEVGSTPARRRLAGENQYLGVSVLSGSSAIPGNAVCTKKPASFHPHALVGRWRVVLREESVCRQQIVLLGEERASSPESLGGKVQIVKLLQISQRSLWKHF